MDWALLHQLSFLFSPYMVAAVPGGRTRFLLESHGKDRRVDVSCGCRVLPHLRVALRPLDSLGRNAHSRPQDFYGYGRNLHRSVHVGGRPGRIGVGGGAATAWRRDGWVA